MDKKEPNIKWFKDIKLKKLKWLWPFRFPLGKLVLVVGDPDIGKSFFTLYMAAQVSTGRPWADGSNPISPSSVLILTLEDDLAETVGVRLKAAGADLSKICVIDSFNKNNKENGLYNLVEDMDVLINTVQSIPDLKLIIIDPLPGYMEGKNENKNAEVREFLNPLINLATVAEISIVGISHLNKNQTTQKASYRTIGSTAFFAAPRAVWLIAKDPENEINRLVVPMKGNLSKKPKGLSFTLINTPIFTSEGTVDMAYCAFSTDPVQATADDLLTPKYEKKTPKRTSAEDWLREYLKDGPKFANEIFNTGVQMGYSKNMLKRVKSKLGIQSVQTFAPDGGVGKWEWSLLA